MIRPKKSLLYLFNVFTVFKLHVEYMVVLQIVGDSGMVTMKGNTGPEMCVIGTHLTVVQKSS